MMEKGFKDIYIANINSPKQIVLSGTAAVLAEAEKFFKNAGAKRAVRLPVAGPFHSPLMADAVNDFLPVLETVNFRDPVIPVFSNVTGKKISSGEEAKKLSCLHITNPVLWLDVEAAVAKAGIEVCFEAGPGNVLSVLWKNSGSEIPVYAAGTATEIESLVKI
jgi:[acyl-carrier-protein] S-malonyltransferase